MSITFSVIDRDGRTPAENPRIAAYAYLARLQSQGRGYSLTSYNGEFTVESPGLMTLTFVPEGMVK